MKKSIVSGSNVTLIGNGPFNKRDLTLAKSLAPFVVAADGGGNALYQTSTKAEAIVGDMDSVSNETIKLYPLDKRYKIKCQDTTDFEKCLGLIEAPKLLGVGFLEGRLDHQLANLSALVKFPHQKCILIGLNDICFLCPEEFSINLPIKTVISIYPMGQTSGFSTGLKYPLDDLNLDPARKVGTSNEVISKVKLRFRERLILIILSKKYLTNVLEVI